MSYCTSCTCFSKQQQGTVKGDGYLDKKLAHAAVHMTAPLCHGSPCSTTSYLHKLKLICCQKKCLKCSMAWFIETFFLWFLRITRVWRQWESSTWTMGSSITCTIQSESQCSIELLLLKNPSIHYLYHLWEAQGGCGQSQLTLVPRSPVHHGADIRNIKRLCSPFNLNCVSLDCGRKPEYPDKSQHRQKGWTGNLLLYFKSLSHWLQGHRHKQKDEKQQKTQVHLTDSDSNCCLLP